jgi:hypothetical protein
LKDAFLEYLFCDWLAETSADMFSKVVCDCRVSGEQIDVLAEMKAENIIYFYECKVALHGDDDTIRQINNKKKALQTANPEKKIVPNLVVFSGVDSDRSAKFTREGIVVIPLFAEKINERRKYTRESITRIDRIMST